MQSPEKRASFWEERLSSLPEGEWAIAESRREMTQHEVKIVCRGVTPWKMSIVLRGRVEFFTGGWVSCCWVPNRDDAGQSEISLSICNVLKNGHRPERKGWALYQRVCELLLSPKEGWCRINWNYFAGAQTPESWHLPDRKGWALYPRVSELVLNPKEGWPREWEEWLQDRRRK